MDRQKVDVHVVISSLFPNIRCTRPRAELAITRAFNRWIAERCRESGARLRWLFVPSFKNPEATVRDMAWARANGAVGILMRGFEGDQFLDHPDFEPVYAKAIELDWPVCVHIGHGSPAMETMAQREGGRFNRFVSDSPNYYAFSVLLNSTLPEKFPTLRFAFFESGCTWVPAAVQTALHLRLNPEDLGSLLRYLGDTRLVGSSDFGHPQDIGETVNYVDHYRSRKDLSESATRGILCDNAHRLFAL
jgi:predicted TIM-barrel fold metal-dependent hydrolase